MSAAKATHVTTAMRYSGRNAVGRRGRGEGAGRGERIAQRRQQVAGGGEEGDERHGLGRRGDGVLAVDAARADVAEVQQYGEPERETARLVAQAHEVAEVEHRRD